MTQKEIQILGQSVPLTFNMATQIAFEKITDKAFDLALLTHAQYRLALYYAAIASANKNTTIELNDLMEADFNDLQAIDKALNELITDFYHLGHVEEQHVPVSDEPEDESSKN